MCVPAGSSCLLIQDAPSSSYAGHFGVQNTLLHLQRYFVWLSLWKQVVDYIQRCSHCSQSRSTNKKIGLYQCLLVSCRAWESISMDFISSLPTTQWKHDCCIFVVLSRISRMTVFIPCSKTTVASTTAILFFQLIWSHFGLPLTIIFDRESRFLSHFWKPLGIF